MSYTFQRNSYSRIR